MPTMTTTIRPATIEDMPKVVACLWLFFLESPWKDVCGEPDPVYAGGWILDRLIHDADSQLFVAETNGEIVGMSGGTILPWPMMSNRTYLWEWAWWVIPELRQTDVAESLWQQLTGWAKAHGAKAAARGRVKAIGEGQIRETLNWECWP